jgi:hypothetical protein
MNGAAAQVPAPQCAVRRVSLNLPVFNVLYPRFFDYAALPLFAGGGIFDGRYR